MGLRGADLHRRDPSRVDHGRGVRGCRPARRRANSHSHETRRSDHGCRERAYLAHPRSWQSTIIRLHHPRVPAPSGSPRAGGGTPHHLAAMTLRSRRSMPSSASPSAALATPRTRSAPDVRDARTISSLRAAAIHTDPRRRCLATIHGVAACEGQHVHPFACCRLRRPAGDHPHVPLPRTPSAERDDRALVLACRQLRGRSAAGERGRKWRGGPLGSPQCGDPIRRLPESRNRCVLGIDGAWVVPVRATRWQAKTACGLQGPVPSIDGGCHESPEVMAREVSTCRADEAHRDVLDPPLTHPRFCARSHRNARAVCRSAA